MSIKYMCNLLWKEASHVHVPHDKQVDPRPRLPVPAKAELHEQRERMRPGPMACLRMLEALQNFTAKYVFSLCYF